MTVRRYYFVVQYNFIFDDVNGGSRISTSFVIIVIVETSILVCCCDGNWWCFYCYDTTSWRGTTNLSYFDPCCWIRDDGLRERGSISFNLCYSISQFFYFTLAPPPNTSESDKPIPPSWCVRYPSNHLNGVDCDILMTGELVGATTTVLRWADTVGTAINFYQILGFTNTLWRPLGILLLVLLLLRRPLLPPPPPGPVFSETPACAVNSARICCISVYGLATTGGVGRLRLVMATKIVCISFAGALVSATAAGAAVNLFDWIVFTTCVISVNALSYVAFLSVSSCALIWSWSLRSSVTTLYPLPMSALDRAWKLSSTFINYFFILY